MTKPNIKDNLLEEVEIEWKALGEVINIKNGKDWKNLSVGNIPVYGSGGVMAYVDKFAYDKPTVLIPRKGSITNIFYVEDPIWNVDTIYYTEIDTTQLIPKFFYYYMKTIDLMKLDTGSGRPSLTQAILYKIPVPLPPIKVQEEIVCTLDAFTKLTEELIEELTTELTARKMQFEYYRNELLNFDDSEIKWQTLRETADFRNGKGHEKVIRQDGRYIVVNSKFVSTNGAVKKYSDIQICPLFINDILIVMSDLPNGKALAKCYLVDEDDRYTLNQRIGALKVKDTSTIDSKFLYYVLSRNKQLLKYNNGVDQTNLKKDEILNILIPIPPLEDQKRIVAIFDRFDTLVDSITQGLSAEINARQKQYEYYRNLLLSFPKSEVEA
ncbi:restriction endonuclease subunit S [Planococcus plakortidis]|uniref:restriction endonuclease subunit S n=1 Tax=Planococcus plakortidis TaxID=1038856 RepID=UPI003984D20A